MGAASKRPAGGVSTPNEITSTCVVSCNYLGKRTSTHITFY